MTSINFYERDTLIKRINDNLNQINQRYFEGNHGILSVTDNGDYVTVCSRNGNQHFDVQGIFDALNNFSLDGFDDRDYYDIWDYLDFCKYILPESQKLLVKLENLLDEIDCTHFSHCRSKLSIQQQNDEIVNICKNDECLSFFIEPLVSSLNNASDIDHSFDDLWDYLEYEFQYHGVKSDNELKTDDELSFCWVLALDDWTISSIPQSQTINTEAFTLSKLVEELKTKNEILEKKNQELEQSKEYNEAWIDNLKQRVHDLESSVYLLQQENKQLKNQSDELKEHFMDVYDFVDSNEIEIS